MKQTNICRLSGDIMNVPQYMARRQQHSFELSALIVAFDSSEELKGRFSAAAILAIYWR